MISDCGALPIDSRSWLDSWSNGWDWASRYWLLNMLIHHYWSSECVQTEMVSLLRPSWYEENEVRPYLENKYPQNIYPHKLYPTSNKRFIPFIFAWTNQKALFIAVTAEAQSYPFKNRLRVHCDWLVPDILHCISTDANAPIQSRACLSSQIIQTSGHVALQIKFLVSLPGRGWLTNLFYCVVILLAGYMNERRNSKQYNMTKSKYVSPSWTSITASTEDIGL